jgi:hypothetical protein
MLFLLEVADKMPSLLLVWAVAGLVGIGGFVLCRRWPRLTLPVIAVAGLTLWLLHAELMDPFVGAAIDHEAGHHYRWQVHIAHALIVALPAAGWLSRRVWPGVV